MNSCFKKLMLLYNSIIIEKSIKDSLKRNKLMYIKITKKYNYNKWVTQCAILSFKLFIIKTM